MKKFVMLVGLSFHLACATGDFGSDLSPGLSSIPVESNDSRATIPSLQSPIVLPEYNYCFREDQEPTDNPRLNEDFCVDNFDKKHPYNYYDTSLNIHCRFLSAEDGKNRCLPENEGSAPMFADSGCTMPMGFAREEDRYLGIDSLDASGSKKVVLEYLRGDAWKNVGAFYYLVSEKGHRNCMSTYFMPLNVSLYYLGDKLSPSMFVEEN